MKHIMFDLETLGKGPTSPIVQIAAVHFDEEGEVLAEFDKVISLGNDFYRFRPDYETIQWWLTQNDTVRQKVFGNEKAETLLTALFAFSSWHGMIGAEGEKKFWSHATFDPPILENAFMTMGQKSGIPHRDYLDIRTLKHLVGDVKLDIRPKESFGAAHDALVDCKFQAHQVAVMMKALKSS